MSMPQSVLPLPQSAPSADRIRISTHLKPSHTLLVSSELCTSIRRKLATRFHLTSWAPSLHFEHVDACITDCRSKAIVCSENAEQYNCGISFALVNEHSYLPFESTEQDANLELVTEAELNSDILHLRISARLRALHISEERSDNEPDIVKENAYEILKTLMKYSTDWMVVKDLDHRFALVSDRFLRSHKKGSAEIIGKNDLEIGTQKELVLGDVAKEWSGYWADDDQAIAAKKPIETEHMVIEENALEQTREHVARVPIKNTAGEVIALLVCVSQVNISKINGSMIPTFASRKNLERHPIIKQLDEKRSQAEAQNMRSQSVIKGKNNFIATASHDLRQPLQAISLFIESLEQKIEDVEQKTILSKMKQSSNDLGELLNSILDISKLDANAVSVKKSHFSIAGLLKTIEDEFENKACKKSINLNINSSNSVVHTDNLLLSRILKNLVSNAVKYTKSGSVNLLTEINGDNLIIRVKDTGPGIPKEQYQSVFMEYHQISDQQSQPNFGQGLGLSIVRRLVELLNLDLKLDSEMGRGTQFSLTIPLGNSLKNQPNNLDRTSNKSTESFKLMVIDDNPIVLEAMEAMLTSMDCDAYPAHDIPEALEIIKELEELPDVLIVDYQLADDVTGDLAIAQVRKAANNDIPAIIVTGNTNSALVRKAAESAYRVLNKPVNPDVLLRTISSAVNERHTSA